MSIYTEHYQDSIEVDNIITTKKRRCILVIFTDASEGKLNSFHIWSMVYGSRIIDISTFVVMSLNLDLSGCHEIWICRIEVPAPKAWEPGCLAAQLPGFGTEAFLSYFLVPAEQLWARDSCPDEHIFHIFRYRSIESKNSRPWETASSRKSCFLRDENVLKASFCTEFLGARAVTRTKQAIFFLLCGRYSS